MDAIDATHFADTLIWVALTGSTLVAAFAFNFPTF